MGKDGPVLAAPEPARVAAYSLEIELAGALRSVHRSCRRIARALQALEPADEPEV